MRVFILYFTLLFAFVPSFLSYITGVSVSELKEGAKSHQRKAFIHTAFFLLGFSVIFIMIGFATSFIGQWFLTIRI
ncbi:cytochrome c biogenesis protein CcdA [Priestia megaterium]